MTGIFGELRRRGVLGALTAYGVAAAGALQLADTVVHNLDLPAWTLRALNLRRGRGVRRHRRRLLVEAGKPLPHARRPPEDPRLRSRPSLGQRRAGARADDDGRDLRFARISLAGAVPPVPPATDHPPGLDADAERMAKDVREQLERSIPREGTRGLIAGALSLERANRDARAQDLLRRSRDPVARLELFLLQRTRIATRRSSRGRSCRRFRAGESASSRRRTSADWAAPRWRSRWLRHASLRRPPPGSGRWC